MEVLSSTRDGENGSHHGLLRLNIIFGVAIGVECGIASYSDSGNGTS